MKDNNLTPEEWASKILDEYSYDIEKLSLQLWKDEMLFGVSGYEVGETGLRRVDPLTPEGQAMLFNDTHTDRIVHIEHLTVDEIIEKYDLTEEQIKNLKNEK